MESLTIGGLARAAGVSVETVRYYERRGLLERPERGAGYRQYSAGDVARLQFVRRAKSFGFTLEEIRELLDAGAGDVLQAARRKQVQVDAERARLTDLSARLGRLVQVCQGGGADCASLTA